MPLLAVEDLRVEFPSRRGAVVAVERMSLEVEPGEILGIVGESGAGKSTIGNAILGLLEPPGEVTGGRMWLDGRDLGALAEAERKKLRGNRIGMIFQDPLTSLNPLYTVGRQLVETIRTHLGLTDSAAEARAVRLLDQVGIEEPRVRLRHYPHQFSGGMRQRVVIALALCADPELLIADEPTTALDVSIQAQILELIGSLCREHRLGVVLITHNMGVIADVTDRVSVMYRGRLVETGPTAEILGRPKHPYTKSLIGAVPRPDVKVARFPTIGYVEDEDARPAPSSSGPGSLRSGWLARGWAGKASDFPSDGGPLVEVDGVSMDFLIVRSIFRWRRRTFTAVDEVSFSIRPGEVFGLVGESGSGKSTIARIITGIYRPTGGRVAFAGNALTAIRDARRLRRFRQQMQMIFQDPYASLNPRMRVLDIVAEPLRFHGLTDSRAETEAIVGDLLERVGLERAAAVRFPHEFSGGQRQRISIARALATGPRFLICDEPTSALDVSIQAQILNLLKDLQEEMGLTMLFISHDLPVIRQMCDRIGVMRHGRLIEVAESEDLFERPRHDYTRTLLALMPKLEILSREGLALGEG